MKAGRVLLAVTAVALLTSSSAVAAPTMHEPELRLSSGPPSVTLAPQFDGTVALDFGIYVVAERAPFEFRVDRQTYRDPIVTTQILRGPNRTLPEGTVDDFLGFPNFVHVWLDDDAGERVFEMSQGFCPGVRAVRARPTAPPDTPYPGGCTENPFTLGAVWGLPPGWGTPAVTSVVPEQDFDVPEGTYSGTVSIDDHYRDLFAIPDHEATATVAVTVSDTVVPFSETGSVDSAAPAGMTAATGGASPASPDERQGGAGVPSRWRPDLRALPAWDIMLMPGPDGSEQLRFASTVWNAGPSPLVVEGFRRPGENVLQAYQFFYHPDGRQVGHAPAGTLEWDPRPGHDHWHFQDFARYRLLDENHEPVVPGSKVSFCILSTDGVDLTVPHAEWRPVFDADQFLACAIEPGTTMSLRQVLDVGFGDTYTPHLPGQSFDITSLPNGTYYIEVEANPDRVLFESDTSHNVSHRKVTLGGDPGARTVEVPPYEGIAG